MALGKRPRERQGEFWIPTKDLAAGPGDPFYERLNELLRDAGFDDFVEQLAAAHYHPKLGQPGLPAGVFFRMLFVGYFEGLNSEREIAWRCSDSLSLRKFLGYALTEPTPDHSTLCKTRQRLPEDAHTAVFRFVLHVCAKANLLSGEGLAIDSSTIDANAALSAVRRRDSGRDYHGFVQQLATTSGVPTPTKADVLRFDKQREGKTLSNSEWEHPHDPDARIAKTKSHGTRMAYKAEHAVTAEHGLIVTAQIYTADQSDARTGFGTLSAANDELVAVLDTAPDAALPAANVTLDNGYHSAEFLEAAQELGFETFVVEKKFGAPGKLRHRSTRNPAIKRNRANQRTQLGRRLYRVRGRSVERSFAHTLETGGLRRIYVRGLLNIRKRYGLHAAAHNLSVLLRADLKVGTPRQLANRRSALEPAVLAASEACSPNEAPAAKNSHHSRHSPLNFSSKLCNCHY